MFIILMKNNLKTILHRNKNIETKIKIFHVYILIEFILQTK